MFQKRTPPPMHSGQRSVVAYRGRGYPKGRARLIEFCVQGHSVAPERTQRSVLRGFSFLNHTGNKRWIDSSVYAKGKEWKHKETLIFE